MVNGKLHFDLYNQYRISVPKGSSKTVFIKVNVADIRKANQTGKKLRLIFRHR
jgi:hypothetical protein